MAIAEADAEALTQFEEEVAATQRYFDSPRFAGTVRLYTARQVVEQRGTIAVNYTVAREAAFHARLREPFAQRKSVTTFGPYSPGQAMTMKRMGIEGIYLGGWATSAKGSTSEDPGPDLASYPLSQVPDEAAVLVRALLTADRNQQFQRLRMSEAQRAATPAYDYRPFIIADADTGHGGDPHVRYLIRRFVEAGVAGYHIEDQRPGTKKCGHQEAAAAWRSGEEPAIDPLYDKVLSPSFNWDTTGMSDEEMKRFPEELSKLGFVFNFITYGGHQIDGGVAKEFITALKQAGKLPEVPIRAGELPYTGQYSAPTQEITQEGWSA